MLHFQYTVLGFFILIVDGQYTDEDDVPKALPDEVVLDLYKKYKEAVDDGHEEGVVTRRQLRLLDREFDIHVRKLKLVNGFKAHNLVIKENTDTGPLIYIDNPLESRVPHAYLTLEEFRKELEKRATRQRDKKSKSKRTEVYFEDSDVDFPYNFNKKDMRRKKVLGGAKIFEAKRTKSRYFEHTYMPGLQHGKKYHKKSPYHYAYSHFNTTTYKLLHSKDHFTKNFNTTPQRKPETRVTTQTQDYETPKFLGTKMIEREDMVKLEFEAEVEETSESSIVLEESAAPETIEVSETIAATVTITAIQITTVPETITYSEANEQPETTAELEKTVKLKSNRATEEKTVLEISLAPKQSLMNHHRHKHNRPRLLGLRSGTTNITNQGNVPINETHNLPTRTLLVESSTAAIIINVKTQDYNNSTVQFRSNTDNETTNREKDLTATDVTEAETTTEDNATTTEVNQTTTDDDITETVMTTEGNEMSKNVDVTETVTTTAVNVQAKEQPVRPIWMRPRYKRITTTRTTTTRRTLGRPLVFMDG